MTIVVNRITIKVNRITVAVNRMTIGSICIPIWAFPISVGKANLLHSLDCRSVSNMTIPKLRRRILLTNLIPPAGYIQRVLGAFIEWLSAWGVRL